MMALKRRTALKRSQIKRSQVAMRRTRMRRGKKKLNAVGPRTDRWLTLRPQIDRAFKNESPWSLPTGNLYGICEARVSPGCTGRGDLYAHGFKRNRDCSIGALLLVVRSCRACGLYLDKDLRPTEMLDLVLERTKMRGWQLIYDWRDDSIQWAESATYAVAVGWFENGYELENADGSFVPLLSVEEAVAAAAVWKLAVRTTELARA
jgi:hypothetical protein